MRENRIRHSVAFGAYGGLLAGILLGLFAWYHVGSHPQPGLDFAALTGWIGLLDTILFFAISHALLGSILSLILILVLLPFGRRLPPFFSASMAFAVSISIYAVAGLFLYRNLSLAANVAADDPIRVSVLRHSLVVGIVVLAAILALAMTAFRVFGDRLFGWRPGYFLLVIVIMWSIRVIWINRGGAGYVEANSGPPETGPVGKVVVIGLDGGTWQAIDRFSSEGLLPNISRLREQGGFGNLVTHGRKVSPAIWTGIATGYRHSRHGIVGFTLPDEETGGRRIVQSGDRRKPALWQILTHYGKSSVVVNWLVSYPAEPLNGVMVSRVVDIDSLTVYPPELTDEVRTTVDSAFDRLKDDPRVMFFGEVEAVFDLADRFLRDGQPDLMMLYISATDRLQHRHWAGLEPERYDETWQLSEEEIQSDRKALETIWAAIDRRIGDLTARLEEGTAVLIVSDHGFKPRAKLMALPVTNRILHALGYVAWADSVGEEIDFSRTTAFETGLDAYDPMVGLYVNVSGRQPEGIVQPESSQAVSSRLVDDLSRITVEETGEPLFLSAGLVSEGGPERLADLGFDVYAEKSYILRTVERGLHVKIRGKEYETVDFLRILNYNSGNHAPRGIVIASGPQFRPGGLLPLCADSPYSVALTYATGYSPALDVPYRLMQMAGFLDPYTSIDVAPTLLYLLGLPVSRDMDGRLMERIISPNLLKRRKAACVDDYGDLMAGPKRKMGTTSRKTMEELKALGYVE